LAWWIRKIGFRLLKDIQYLNHGKLPPDNETEEIKNR
jgi:hypothetical protein